MEILAPGEIIILILIAVVVLTTGEFWLFPFMGRVVKGLKDKWGDNKKDAKKLFSKPMKNDKERGGAEVAAISILLLVVLIIGGIAYTSKLYYIHPGNVGVLIYKGGQDSKGVAPTPLQPGWGTRKLFVEGVEEYPVFLQTAIWTKNNKEGNSDDESLTANTKEGLPVNMDVSISYTLDPSKVPDLYVKYRQDIHSIQETYMRQTVRQAVQDVFGQYAVDEIYGEKKQEVVSKIQEAATTKLSPDGFNITQFTVNEIRLPQSVTDSITQKISASQAAQKAEQDLARIKIEAEQRVAQAQAEAEAIKIQAEAITQQGGENYVQLKAVEKWNGVMPTYITGGSPLPFVNVAK